MNLECSREINIDNKVSRKDNRENRGGISDSEWNGVGGDEEFGGIENDERGGGDDVEVDGDRT